MKLPTVTEKKPTKEQIKRGVEKFLFEQHYCQNCEKPTTLLVCEQFKNGEIECEPRELPGDEDYISFPWLETEGAEIQLYSEAVLDEETTKVILEKSGLPKLARKSKYKTIDRDSLTYGVKGTIPYEFDTDECLSEFIRKHLR